MYIRITDLCNMKCEHCAFSSGPFKDHQHMDRDTFLHALDLAERIGDTSISIGGGEPTVHPEFWEYLRRAIRHNDEFEVWLATNGKRKQDALVLGNLNYSPEDVHDLLNYDDQIIDKYLGSLYNDEWDRFSCELSLDIYHDPISSEVETLFKRAPRDKHVRTVDTFQIANVGRAAETGAGTTDRCACETTCVHPDGTIGLCGCPDSETAGTVRNPDMELLEAFYGSGQDCAAARKADCE